MFQTKIYEIFKELPKSFSIANGIFILGYNYDATDDDRILCRVLQICREERLKLNKVKSYSRCTSIPFSRESTSRLRVQSIPWNLHVVTEMPPPKSKNDLRSFLGIMNYLKMFLLAMSEICQPWHRPTLINRIDLEQDIPRCIWKSKITN